MQLHWLFKGGRYSTSYRPIDRLVFASQWPSMTSFQPNEILSQIVIETVYLHSNRSVADARIENEVVH